MAPTWSWSWRLARPTPHQLLSRASSVFQQLSFRLVIQYAILVKGVYVPISRTSTRSPLSLFVLSRLSTRIFPTSSTFAAALYTNRLFLVRMKAHSVHSQLVISDFEKGSPVHQYGLTQFSFPCSVQGRKVSTFIELGEVAGKIPDNEWFDVGIMVLISPTRLFSERTMDIPHIFVQKRPSLVWWYLDYNRLRRTCDRLPNDELATSWGSQDTPS